MEWDERVAASVESIKREKRARGLATGSEEEGSRAGRPVGETEVREAAVEEVGFERRAFVYQPPAYGTVGLLPETVVVVVEERSGEDGPGDSEDDDAGGWWR